MEVALKDVFDLIDNWNHRLNIFREHRYVARVVWIFSWSMLLLWIVLGYDSGVQILEDALTGLPLMLRGEATFLQWITASYVSYGRSFHFSSYLFYGLLFYACSRHMARLGIVYSRNVLLSGFMVCLNVSVFEWVYMTCFAVFQTQRNIIEWITMDWWFLQQYFILFMLGALGFFAFYIESYHDKGRTFTFHPNKTVILLFIVTVCAWPLWIYYPFPTQQFIVNGWTSNTLFPQTDYAYFGDVYIQNNLLHTVNLLVKALMVILQAYVISRFRVVDHGGL